MWEDNGHPALSPFPIKVLTPIVSNLSRPDLARLMRVNSMFRYACAPFLYSRVRLGDAASPPLPLDQPFYFSLLRCLDIVPHKVNECRNIKDACSPSYTRWVKVVRYHFLSSVDSDGFPRDNCVHDSGPFTATPCWAAMGLQPTTVVLVHPKLTSSEGFTVLKLKAIHSDAN